MPLTVITLTSVPQSLRGDLSKWMQEIATGVYVGNFNVKIREKLWKRVQENIGNGQATLSYACINEIGYNFETYNTARRVIELDGIPLVFLPSPEASRQNVDLQTGFSNASKFRKAKKFSSQYPAPHSNSNHYVVIDIETDGLDPETHSIIEIAAVKVSESQTREFHRLIKDRSQLPEKITKLTGITNKLLEEEGEDLKTALFEFVEFCGRNVLIGYNVQFDVRFINSTLDKLGMVRMQNKTQDLLRFVKRDKKLLSNYRLETVLPEYGINERVLHRALEDARLIYQLSTKVNNFSQFVAEK